MPSSEDCHFNHTLFANIIPIDLTSNAEAAKEQPNDPMVQHKPLMSMGPLASIEESIKDKDSITSIQSKLFGALMRDDLTSNHKGNLTSHGKNDIPYNHAPTNTGQLGRAIEQVTLSCSDGWYITSYYTPLESDFSTRTATTIRVEEENCVKRSYSFNSDFIDDVKIEGAGKTRYEWYLGYWEGGWHKHLILWVQMDNP